MDPLSIAASVAGLASLTGQVFKVLNDYRNAVKDAKLDVTTLATELRTLSGMLHNLSLLAATLKASGSSRLLFGESQIFSLRCFIEKIEAELYKARDDFNNTKLKGAIRSLRWSFSKSDIDKMITDLRAHKDTITLALSADTLDKLAECLELEKEIRTEVASQRDVIERLQEMHAKVKMDGERQKTVDYFLKVNPHPMLQMSLRLRKDATGGWLFNEPPVMRWMSETNSKLWLSGLAGSGKTVLAGAVIERVVATSTKNTAVAFFFCDYKNVETQNLCNILSSLALQIALQNAEAFAMLQRLYSQLHPPSGLPRQPEARQLVDTITSMSRLFDKVVVIVDALDECMDDTREVVGGITEIAKASASISVAIFGRYEDDLSSVLLPEYQHIELAARADDLALYIGAEMTRRPALNLLEPLESEEIRQKLIAKANGMFRWVACQLDWLERLTKIGRETALDELPPTLDKTYDRILKTLSKRSNSFARQITRMTLHWLCLDGHSLTIAQLCEALSLALKHEKRTSHKVCAIKEEEIIKYCSSLIRKNDDDDKFELAHFTVKEYLYTVDTSSELGEFRYSESGAVESLTVLSLECILLPDFNRRLRLNGTMAELEVLVTMEPFKNHPFYPYATGFWTRRPLSHKAPVIRRLLKDLFGPRKKINFQNWILYFAVERDVMFRDAEEQDRDATLDALMKYDINPLHVAASLPIPWLCEWLLQSGTNVNATARYRFSAIHFALIGPNIFCTSPTEEKLAEFLKEDPRTANDAASVGATIEILLKNSIEVTQTPLFSIGALALEVSVALESDIPFIVLLKYAADQCLTQSTLNRMKALFAEQEPDIDHPLHEILQAVLDLEYHSGEEGYITAAVSFVQELLRSGASWDTYSHNENQFLPSHFEDEEFVAYIQYIITQNRPKDVSLIFEDCRFEKYTQRGDEVAENFWKKALVLAAKDDSSDVFRVLIDKGYKPLEKDTQGNTIWHIAAQNDSINVLLQLFEVGLNVQSSLGAVSQNGRTPLAEAMFYSRVKTTELLLDHCDNDPAHFQSQPPILHMSVGMSSQPLFQKLYAKNFPGMDKALDGSTPLHFVNGQCGNEFLQALTALYDTNEQRQDGKVAFQTYITSVLDSGLPERLPAGQLTSIIKMLAPTNFMVTRRIHLWEDFCHQLGLAGNKECSLRKSESFLSLITAFRDAHIIDSYEQQYQKPALVPFVENLEYLDFKAGMYRWEASFVQKAMEVLRETSANRPVMAKDHPAPIALLKKAIVQDYYPLVRELINNGVSVHIRVNGSSALEQACYDGSLKIFDMVLHRADLAIINGEKGTNPDILCRIIAASWTPHKLSSSLAYGASPDAIGLGGHFLGYPAITVAAWKKNYKMVDILKQAGADILARDPRGWDLVHYYIFNGRLDLLRGISDELETDSYDWDRGVRLNLDNKKSRGSAEWQGCTSLHIAAFTGITELMEYLLQNGRCGNVDATSSESRTPLHVASYRGHINAINYLIIRGANVNAIDDEGKLPIDLALMNGEEAAVEVLKLALVEPRFDSEDELDSTKSDTDDNSLEGAAGQHGNEHQWLAPPRIALAELEKSMKQGDLTGCQTLVANGCPLDRPMISCGRCDVLTYAVLTGWEDIIAWLLLLGIMPKACRCTMHRAPSTIHVAVTKHGISTACMNQLLDRALETGHEWHFYPLSPLHLASLQISTSFLKVILHHVADHTDAYWTIFRKFPHKRDALPQDKVSFVEYLVNSPAGVCDDEVPKEWHCNLALMTPLHLAVANRRLALVQTLFDAGARVNVVDANGDTPLTVAVINSNGDCGIVKCLLDHGADINQKNGVGYSPIMIAAANNYVQVAKYLMGKGAHFEDESPWGQNLLHISARQGALECFAFFHQQGSNPSTLSEYGVSVIDMPAQHLHLMMPYILNTRMVMDASGEHTSRTLCSYIGFHKCTLVYKALRSLTRTQARHLLNTRTKGMSSPLCAAICKNCMVTVTRLLDFGADIELEGSVHGTPLMYACVHDRIDIIKQLVRRGAQITYISRDGVQRSALMAARAFPRVIHYLIASRHWDQPRLSAEAHNNVPTEIRLQAGPQVRVVQYDGYYAPHPDQSTWERLRSRENLKRLIREGKLDVHLVDVGLS